MPRILAAEHLQRKGIFEVQEQPHLHLPQLLRLLQTKILYLGECEEPGVQRRRDGPQVDPCLLG